MRRVKLDRPHARNKVILAGIDKILTFREKEILSLRLPWTQEEVGKKYNLTKERIRAIEAKAMENLLKEIKGE